MADPPQEIHPAIGSPDTHGLFLAELSQLIRIPSRSNPAGGEEGALQHHVATRMIQLGVRVTTHNVDDLAGIRDDPLFFGAERDYTNRPLVLGEIGPTEGPALLIVAHADTVPEWRGRAGRYQGERVLNAQEPPR